MSESLCMRPLRISKYRKDNSLLSLDSFLEPDRTTEVLEVDKKINP